MPILGLTDTQEDSNPVYEMLGVADVKCYKGARKTGRDDSTRPGEDLKESIRIVTGHKAAIGIIRDTYAAPNNDGDFLVDKLNLYLALDDPDLTFETQMKAFDGSGILYLCDRDTIYKQAETVQTCKGKRRVLKSCDKPCPLRGDDSWDCPNECKPNGMLHFYIRELLDSDLMVHCQFEMKAWGDVGNIIKQIRRIKNELGSLTQSPFPCYWTRHKIPLVLTRIERSRKRPATTLKPQEQWKRPGKKEYEFTGKKGDAKFWDLDLQVDPVWMDWYRKQQLAQELISRGLSPTKQVIAGLMTGEVLDAKTIALSAVDIQALPPAPTIEAVEPIADETIAVQEPVVQKLTITPTGERTINRSMVMQLEDAFDEAGWTTDAVDSLLKHYSINELAQVTQEQRLELLAIATNRQLARQWNDRSNSIIETITESDWKEIIYPVFLEYKWNSKAVMGLLQQKYGISRIGELLKTQIEEIVELAKNEDIRSRWIS